MSDPFVLDYYVRIMNMAIQEQDKGLFPYPGLDDITRESLIKRVIEIILAKKDPDLCRIRYLIKVNQDPVEVLFEAIKRYSNERKRFVYTLSRQEATNFKLI